MARRQISGRKLLVASVGVASLIYVGCSETSGNLVAVPCDDCNQGGQGGSEGGSGGSEGGSGGSEGGSGGSEGGSGGSEGGSGGA